MISSLNEAQSKRVTVREFSEAVDIPLRTLHFWKNNSQSTHPNSSRTRGRKNSPANRLSAIERKAVVDVLLRAEWMDLSPREIYYKLLDEEQKIIASPATFYRVAGENQLNSKRGPQPSGKKLNRETPHLMATQPNEIWSWDVSQIRSSIRTKRFYLYVIIDIWSRYVVGWALEDHEKTVYAIQMWKKALEDQLITGQGLINHKDNGSIMTSDEMIDFVRDAQMVDSYSRAGVSDDNPFSESLFASIKRFREFPETFETLDDGRSYFTTHFSAYNHEHRHSGIQFMAPSARHYGEEAKILNIRNQLAAAFYDSNRHRYSRKPKIFTPIIEVRIN